MTPHGFPQHVGSQLKFKLNMKISRVYFRPFRTRSTCFHSAAFSRSAMRHSRTMRHLEGPHSVRVSGLASPPISKSGPRGPQVFPECHEWMGRKGNPPPGSAGNGQPCTLTRDLDSWRNDSYSRPLQGCPVHHLGVPMAPEPGTQGSCFLGPPQPPKN